MKRETSYQFHLLKALLLSCNTRGNQHAFCIEGSYYTYNELASRVGQMLTFLEAQNIKDQFIGVATSDQFDTYAAIIAVLFNGSAYVPIYANNPVDRTNSMIEKSGVSTVLYSKKPQWVKGVQNCNVVDLSVINGAPKELILPSITDDDLAYLFFTSGSTGAPKGVPVSYRNLHAFFSNLLGNDAFEFTSEDHHLQMFELTFDLSVMSIFTPLCTGACCYIVPEKGVSYLNIFKLLSEYPVSVALMVPSVLSYLQKYFEEIHLSDMRYSLFCGEALPAKLANDWAKCLPNATVYNVYGPTEATIFCTLFKVEKEHEFDIVPIGKPMGNTQTFITESGELCLAGDQVTKGYWNDPEKNATAFVDLTIDGNPVRAYRTGDLAKEDEQHGLLFCGRNDAQVKINGFRIELGDIEHHARKFCDTNHLVAITVENQLGNPSIHLFIAKSIDLQELKMYFSAQLPSYMHPEKIHLIEEMPYNLNGKIDRNALKAMKVT